ncbi:MAG: hypothetical protein K5640_02525 [Treponema sp.]|nr:hypothetical protein [Treponema sp.]
MSKCCKFSLSPDFCMFNGAAIIEQDKNKIHFGLVRPEDTELRMKLFMAFATFLRDKNIVAVPVLTFSLLTQRQLLHYVSSLCKKISYSFKGEESDKKDFLVLRRFLAQGVAV